MQTPKLLPCPFCGGKRPTLYDLSDRIYPRFSIICNKCLAHMVVGGDSFLLASGDTRENLKKWIVGEWNRRAPATPQPKQRRDCRKCAHYRASSDGIDHAWCAKCGPDYECRRAHGCPNYREGGDHAEAR